MGYKFNPFTANLDKSISYWSKNGSVLSPKSSERIDLSEIRAKDGNGLKLYEDGGAGIFIKDGGNIGINQNNPVCKLQATGGAVLFDGTTGATPTSGAGTRMMWIPAKVAFRAGQIAGTQWDNANIGSYSSSFGYNGIASGFVSTHFGNSGTTSGDYSTHFGASGLASNNFATHFGYNGTASGGYSLHFGQIGTASGSHSIHFGYNGTASGIGSTHFGANGIAAGNYSLVGGNYMQLSSAAINSFAWGHHTSAVALTLPNVFYIFPSGTAGRVAIGTTTPATSAIMDLTSTTGALLLSRMTTAQKNALTAVNGMILYDATLNQTQTYENGAWRQI